MYPPLRIAITHIRHAMTGGVERYLNYISAYLAEQGHNVSIICRSHEETPHPDVRFVVLRPLSLTPAHRIHAFAGTVEQHLLKTRYDIVYGLGRTWTQDVLRLGGGSHATYLEKAHDITRSRLRDFLKLSFLRHKVALDIEKKALTDHLPLMVICNSHMVKQDIIRRYHAPADRIAVIHNGTDVEKFNRTRYIEEAARLREQNGISADERVFLFLGTGYKRKGLDLALKAFSGYMLQGDSARLIVAGYDSSLENFREMARHLKLAQATIFLGGRRDPEVLYAASDVFLLPTRYDPFANATVEALASGLPVITSKDNGGCELIENGINGHIVDVGADETGAIVNAMRYWQDQDTLKRGRSEARSTSLKNAVKYKMEETARLLLEVYGQKRTD
jgi:UDP-glucose:(heptosyl)LPS alpha-1,3-glucosyltransferase